MGKRMGKSKQQTRDNNEMCEFSENEIIDWDEIVSIEYKGQEDTIDINVTGDRLFWANDILTHNSGGDAATYQHSHIAGGLSKINTADNVLGIYITPSMRDNGRYQIQFMKTRSSSGVGSSVDLEFNQKSLRIIDLPEGAEETITLNTNSTYEKLKKNSIVRQQQDEPKETTNVFEAAEQLRNLVKRK
jgi:predicted DNA-binding antitoxin AbrB/MazE fold protein